MLKPFYQGKLDVFCALYAVINGLRLTHGIRTLKGRDILNDTLYELALTPPVFRDVLEQKTDYVFLVDKMLASLAKRYPLEIIKPFGVETFPDIEVFWSTFHTWLNPNGSKAENRAIICRFCRYKAPGKEALVRHWTTIDSITDKKMHLYDSSHEADSIQIINKDSIALLAKDVTEMAFLHMQPDTARMLRLPF